MKLPKFSFKKNVGTSGLMVFRVIAGLLVVIALYNIFGDWRVIKSSDQNQTDTKNNPLSIDFDAYDKVEKHLQSSGVLDQSSQNKTTNPFEAGESIPASNDQTNNQPAPGQSANVDPSTQDQSPSQPNQ